MNEKSYQLLKEIESENAIVRVYEVDNKTEEEERKILINIYDVINDIADNLTLRGIDTSNWFLKQKQLKQMEKSSDYRFI